MDTLADFALVLLVFGISTISSQKLESSIDKNRNAHTYEPPMTAIPAGKLPMPLYRPMVSYDKSDSSIYIFGGVREERYQNQILRYDIATSTTTYVGNIPGFGWIYEGAVQLARPGEFFYFGGDNSQNSQAYKFNRESNHTIKVADLPRSVNSVTTVIRESSSAEVILFGGNGKRDGVLKFDLETFESSEIGSLPSQCTGNPTSVLVEDKAHIFCQSFNSTSNDSGSLLVMNLNFMDSQTILMGWPRVDHPQSAIFNGQHIYIIGGYFALQGLSTNGMIKVDPMTHLWTFVPLNDMPIRNQEYFYKQPPTAVYVEEMNRIYMIGGVSMHKVIGDTSYHDDVWYVDLNPAQTSSTTNNPPPSSPDSSTYAPTTTTTLSPDTFNCNNRTDGYYPHSLDCTLYLVCYDGLAEVRPCPRPFNFDPLLRLCRPPEVVDCLATTLYAVHMETKLPKVLHSITVFYDGEDSIYLFGGTSLNSYQSDVIMYDIPSGSLTNIGSMPYLVHGATSYGDGVGNILTFGGAGFGTYPRDLSN
ncbi:uncharacterized protein LOC118435913 [Folsomia candida]|uniref:uncharacterized protein LOC118435913 n=1 Tax=Folsomia candida TaxID=158441 RepID=UPI001605207A|nr:uncharacterized protein LOC118435913 [Folsomia candida]